MSEHPDDDWCALLAGEDVPDAPAAMKREAQLLRRALAERNAEIEGQAMPAGEVEAGLAAMLGQARAQGLLEPARRTAPEPAKPSWTARLAKWLGLDDGRGLMPALAVAATLVLGVGVALVMAPGQTPPPDLVRGGTPSGPAAGLPRETADPAGAARALADALRGLGLTVEVSEDLGLWFVTADVRPADPAAVRTLLAREGIAVPADGRLKAVFAPKR